MPFYGTTTMTETSNIYNLEYYDSYIIDNYVVDHCGIDLNKLGRKTDEFSLRVNLDGEKLIDENLVRAEIHQIIKFIQNYYSKSDERPIWHKINVVDQALNQYEGVGFLSLSKNWLNFIINYLDIDRAEHSGDTIISIFDRNFIWAVSFTLSQDESILKIERYQK